MRSILGEISKLRNGVPIIIDYHNSNRYRLVVQENDGSKTAYYFSTPIYNIKTKRMVDVNFKSNGDIFCLTGSNSNIMVSNNILLENTDGTCTISLPNKCTFVSSQDLRGGNVVVVPTTNGVALKCSIEVNKKIDFIVDVEKPFLNVRANDKYFALMKERFKPFVVFSCIGATDLNSNVISPAKIEYQKITDKRYKIIVSPISPLAKHIIFEANLYENKLFQDTTVESINPNTNNAFGSVGFIGNSLEYGEQWLYSRLDYSKIPEITDKRIYKIVLHMPKLNKSKLELSAYKVLARFCSFGSNWKNKIAEGPPVSDSLSNNGYQSLDLKPLLFDEKNKTIIKTEGFILKSKNKDNGFSVISTGDSYLAPQIMEVNFR